MFSLPSSDSDQSRASGIFSGKRPTEEEQEEQTAAKRASDERYTAYFQPATSPSRTVQQPPAPRSSRVKKAQKHDQSSVPQRLFEKPGFASEPNQPPPKVSQPPPSAQQPPPAEAKDAKMQEEAVRDLARSINHLLARSLTNMLDLMGSVCWKLGDNDVRHSLVYLPHGPKDKREDPLSFLRIIDEDDTNLTSMGYFISKYAPKLGMPFLRAYLQPWMDREKAKTEKLLAEPLQKKPATSPTKSQIPLVGASHCFDFQEDLDRSYAFGTEVIDDDRRIAQLSAFMKTPGFGGDASVYAQRLVYEKMRTKAQELLTLPEPEMAFAPAWAFELLSSDVFRAFVAPARLAAVDLAHAQVTRIRGCETFTVKELICSKGVVDQFAWMIAYQYMDASKGLPMHRPKGEKGERGIYVNINHMRETVQKRAFLCTIWFESVRAFPNPILAQFTEYRAKQYDRAKKVHLLDTPEKEFAWNAAMDMYYQSLPKRELKYVGQ
jgi:hypothetical protein